MRLGSTAQFYYIGSRIGGVSGLQAGSGVLTNCCCDRDNNSHIIINIYVERFDKFSPGLIRWWVLRESFHENVLKHVFPPDWVNAQECLDSLRFFFKPETAQKSSLNREDEKDHQNEKC